MQEEWRKKTTFDVDGQRVCAGQLRQMIQKGHKYDVGRPPRAGVVPIPPLLSTIVGPMSTALFGKQKYYMLAILIITDCKLR